LEPELEPDSQVQEVKSTEPEPQLKVELEPAGLAAAVANSVGSLGSLAAGFRNSWSAPSTPDPTPSIVASAVQEVALEPEPEPESKQQQPQEEELSPQEIVAIVKARKAAAAKRSLERLKQKAPPPAPAPAPAPAPSSESEGEEEEI
jgi:hypothetical protein